MFINLLSVCEKLKKKRIDIHFYNEKSLLCKSIFIDFIFFKQYGLYIKLLNSTVNLINSSLFATNNTFMNILEKISYLFLLKIKLLLRKSIFIFLYWRTVTTYR